MIIKLNLPLAAIALRCVSNLHLKRPWMQNIPDITRFDEFYYEFLSDVTYHGDPDCIDRPDCISEILLAIEIQRPDFLILIHHHCCKTIKETFDSIETEQTFYTERLLASKQKAVKLFPHFKEENILVFYLNADRYLVPVDIQTEELHNQVLAVYGKKYAHGKTIECHPADDKKAGSSVY